MKRRGALLIEAGIAAALVAVAMVAVAQLLAVSAVQERALDQRRVAAQEAANVLETVLVRPWEELTAEQFKELKLSAEAMKRLPDGQMQCDVDLLSEQPPVKKLVAEASWRNQAGERERVRLCAWKFRSEEQP